MENVEYKIRSLLFKQSLVWNIDTKCKKILDYGKEILLCLMAMLLICFALGPVFIKCAFFHLKYANKDIQCVIPLAVTFLTYLTSLAAVCRPSNVMLGIWKGARPRSDS
jgi:hypothetical protein